MDLVLSRYSGLLLTAVVWVAACLPAAVLSQGASLNLDPGLLHKLLSGLKQAAERVAARGRQLVVRCSQSIRRHPCRLSDRVCHAIPMMRLNEVDALVCLQSIDTIRIDAELAQPS
jgi:flagellar biosynthesis protein FlhA